MHTLIETTLLSGLLGFLMHGTATAAMVQSVPVEPGYQLPVGPPAPPPTWTGPKRLAVVLIDLSDSPYNFNNQPGYGGPANNLSAFKNYVSNRMFGSGSSLKTFWEQCSYNRITLQGDVTDVYGPIPIPHTAFPCDRPTWAQAALGVLSRNPAYGFDVSDYDMVAYSASAGSLCKSIGLGYLTPPGAMLDNFTLRASVHEMGHGLGLAHSSSLECELAGSPVGESCMPDEYGDLFDSMGGNDSKTRTYNVQKRGQLGWLQSGEVLTVTSSGTFEINPLHALDSAIRGIRVPRVMGPYGVEQYLYVELRQPNVFDDLLPSEPATNGTLIHLGRRYDIVDRTHLLDSTPGDQVIANAAYVPGPFRPAVYTDPDTGTTITTTSLDLSSPQVELRKATVEVNYGGMVPCSYGLPSVTLVPDTLTIRQGETGLYAIEVTNFDSQYCPRSTIAGTTTDIPSDWGSEATFGFEAYLEGGDFLEIGKTLNPGPNPELGTTVLHLSVVNLNTGYGNSATLTVTIIP